MITQTIRVEKTSNNNVNENTRRDPELFHELFLQELNKSEKNTNEFNDNFKNVTEEIICLLKKDYGLSEIKIHMLSEILNKSDECLMVEMKVETKKIFDSVSGKTIDNQELKDSSNIVQPVYMTKNYSIIQFALGNRNLTYERVKTIEKSIKKCGLRRIPIVVNKHGNIIDGQHRYVAARNLGLPIYYVIDPDADVEVARLINNTQSGWKFIDYVHSWSSMGNEDYGKLEFLLEDSSLAGISAGTKIAATSGIYHNSSNGLSKRIVREGKYKFTCYDSDVEVAKSRLKEARDIYNIFYKACDGKTDVKKDLFMNAIIFLTEYKKSISISILKKAMENNCREYHSLQREPFESYVKYLCTILFMEDGRRKINTEILLKKYKDINVKREKEKLKRESI